MHIFKICHLEGSEDTLICHAVLFHKAGGLFFRTLPFQLNSKCQILLSDILQEGIQSNDIVHPAAALHGEGSQFGIGIVCHSARLFHHSLYRIVVEQYRYTVFGHLHIGFDAVGTHIDAGIKRKQGVFRAVFTGTPVGIGNKFHYFSFIGDNVCWQ